MSNNSYKQIRRGFRRKTVVTMLILALLVIAIGDYSVDKGIIQFAQGKTSGNIVSKLNSDGITLKSFSKVQAVKEAIVFEDVIEDEVELYTVHEDELYEQELLEVPDIELFMSDSIDMSGEDLEKQVIESFGLSSDYKVTLGDEVGVSSETTALVLPGTPTDRESTLLQVRSATKHIDESYEGVQVSLTSKDRDLVERLVQGEAGAEGFIGAALVAQTLRDTMVESGIYDLMEIKKAYGYSGRLVTKPNQEVLDAVAFIFDNGGYIVQHRLTYFYSFNNTKSGFHESQKFILEHGGHRFFDKKN